MLQEKDIIQILATLRDPSASDDEKVRCSRLFAVHEDEIRMYLQGKFNVDSSAGIPIHSSEREIAYERLHQRLFAAERRARSGNIGFIRAAAIVIIAISAAVIAGLFRKPPQEIKSPVLALQSAPLPKIYDTIRNRYSQPAGYTLPDGSGVKLRPGSYCYYERGLPGDKKVVYLGGAGVFTVKRDKDHPFSVYVKGIEVRDLGTVFSVCSDETNVRVKLIKGKVLIHSLDVKSKWKDIVMVPDQVFKWNALKEEYALSNPGSENKGLDRSPDTESLRIASGIVFQTTSLNKVLDSIGKRTGMSFVYDDRDLEGKSFTGTISAGQTFESLIYKICLLNDLHYHIQKNKVFIRLLKK